MTPPQITLFVIIGIAFALLLTERIRNDLVAVMIVIALVVTGLLAPEEALSGFSSEPALILASVFVLTGALEYTGVSRAVGMWIGRWAGSTLSRAIAVIMPSVALLAAFAEHVTTTAVMLPITINLAKEKDIPVSKLLLPMSFAASLGSAITIIGAPAFLVASGLLTQAGRAPLSVFSITPIGLALVGAGTLFTVLIGQHLLPSRSGGADLLARYKLDRYFTEISVEADAKIVGMTYADFRERPMTYNFEVKRWIRKGKELRTTFSDLKFEAGDVLLVEATPEDLASIRENKNDGLELRPVEEYPDHAQDADDIGERLVQAVIAPNADVIGRTIGEVDFRERFGAVVVGLWRQNGLFRQHLSKLTLQAGDVLVIEGDEDAIERVQNNPAFLMMMPFMGEAYKPRKAALAVAAMVGTVLLAAFHLVPLVIATLIGAAAVVLTGCINARQAYRAIDQRIFVFIAGAIPLGLAMRHTGASDLIAAWLETFVSGWQPFWVLIGIFFIVSWITQIMSDSATVALFGPVSIALAQALNLPPEPFVVTVAMAAVGAFWTPIGHHGNLIIYGPGRYEFKDFLLLGGLLTVIVAPIVAAITLALWGHLPAN